MCPQTHTSEHRSRTHNKLIAGRNRRGHHAPPPPVGLKMVKHASPRQQSRREDIRESSRLQISRSRRSDHLRIQGGPDNGSVRLVVHLDPIHRLPSTLSSTAARKQVLATAGSLGASWLSNSRFHDRRFQERHSQTLKRVHGDAPETWMRSCSRNQFYVQI